MGPNNYGMINGSVVGKVGEPSEEEKRQKRQGKIKALIIGGVIGLAFLIIGGLLAVIQGKSSEKEEEYVKESTKVAVFASPITAETRIDGEIYKNGIYEMEPGEYTIEITASGYQSRAYKYTIKPDRVNLLYDYLDKTEGELNEKDVDALRFLVNDDETRQKVENYLSSLAEDFAFPSALNSSLRGFDKVQEYYGEQLTDYSYRLINETLSAYFYLARSGTRNARVEKESLAVITSREGFLETAEFRVTADGAETYRVLLEILKLEDEGVVKKHTVYRVTVLTEAGTALFQYDGRYLSNDDEVYYEVEDTDEEWEIIEDDSDYRDEE